LDGAFDQPHHHQIIAETIQQDNLEGQQLLKVAIEYIYRHLPDRDRGVVKHAQIVRSAQLAIAARKAHPWAAGRKRSGSGGAGGGGGVPLHVWLESVLPHRHLDEPYEDWRPALRSVAARLVANATSLAHAAQLLNRDLWRALRDPPIIFSPDLTPEIMAPSQVIAAGRASCTGLSILLASACRAVGVPARVAGAFVFCYACALARACVLCRCDARANAHTHTAPPLTDRDP
jgi:transglutaminase-like putative cysteine protease